MLKGKNIVLGVTGGIAVYKACDLTSKLVQQGANVKVVMTENAKQFVSPLTFQALSRNPVYDDTFDEKNPAKIAHIDLSDWAEIFIIAPATANTIGQIASGLGHDMLTSILLATRAEKYVAPAMNVHMYANPFVQENMKKLEKHGYHFIEPGAGYLACGYVGKGRMEEPLSIIQVIDSHYHRDLNYTGKTILVSAGPTREALDPVRFLSNRSSGKMGLEIAKEAAAQGANVILVTGANEPDIYENHIQVEQVSTAEEMYQRMHQYYDQADVVIKAAAVSDYRPKHYSDQKLKKQSDNMIVEFERTKDILKSLGEQKTHQYLVGFAAETDKPLAYGKEKLAAKNLNMIVVNDVSAEGAGFQIDTNIVTLIDQDHHVTELPKLSKTEVARALLQAIYEQLKDESK